MGAERVAKRPEQLVVVVVGPTASGKTALSVALAERLGGEIVNADAMAVYRGMDIGTAKPDETTQDRVPHHLVDVWPIEHAVSVEQVQELGRAAIAGIHERGRVAIVVGGSGLYVNAIIDDLRFPGTDDDLRAALNDELERVGPEAMHERLAAADPAAAAAILPTNGRRIVRALEVIELTGGPFVASLPAPVSVYEHVSFIGLEIDRGVLDERITARVDAMWAAGFVDEVRGLTGLAATPTASRALGYSQVLAYLDGTCSEAEAKADTVAATRKFARRQQRWWARDTRIHWVSALSPSLLEDALATLT